MRDEGKSDDEIISALKPNYSNQEVNDAMNQAKQDIPEDNVLEELDKIHNIPRAPNTAGPNNKKNDETEELFEEAPNPDYYELEAESPQLEQDYQSYGVQSAMSSDQIQQIIEAVVEEKWDDLTSKVGDLNLWKETLNNDIESIKQEILRLRERINSLQDVMLGKVTEYSKNITSINTEMKALEQVFQRILQPLTSNIRDLNKVTEELKRRRHHTDHHTTKSVRNKKEKR